MRISDWSSDVCSSDLSPHDASIEPHPHPAISRAADRAIAEHRLVAFVEQVLDPAVKREALADRQLGAHARQRSEEHTSGTPVTNAHLVCRLLLEKKQ